MYKCFFCLFWMFDFSTFLLPLRAFLSLCLNCLKDNILDMNPAVQHMLNALQKAINIVKRQPSNLHLSWRERVTLYFAEMFARGDHKCRGSTRFSNTPLPSEFEFPPGLPSPMRTNPAMSPISSPCSGQNTFTTERWVPFIRP